MSDTRLTRLDKARIRAAFDRAAGTYDEAAVLQRRVGEHMLERLDVIKFEPRTILDAGCGTGHFSAALLRRYRGARLLGMDLAHGMLKKASGRQRWFRRPTLIEGDAEALPLADASVDMVFSNLTIQWCDPRTVLAEFARVLRPGGLLMFTSFGPDTLIELRRAWAAVDAGVHVHDFVDMHDVGDALVDVGFATPVLDVERYTLTYPDALGVLRDLQHLGARNAAEARAGGLTGKSRFERFRAAYEANVDQSGRVPATYEVVYGHAWAPESARAPAGEVHVPVAALRRGTRG
jgi:malonyl-CoA O-methyltransferase